MELSGTFPLPESQLDRFLMRIELGYPDREAERQLLKGSYDQQKALQDMKQSIAPADVLAFQKQVDHVHASDAFLNYLQDLLTFTRSGRHFHMGLSPRAGLALLQAARSWAFICGRDYALPEDLQAVLIGVVGHRLRSKDELAEIPMRQLEILFQEVPVS
jgi:MoxR-like ATPase